MNVCIPLLILCVIGLALYYRMTRPATSEIGRLIFVSAFLALCLSHAWVPALSHVSGR